MNEALEIIPVNADTRIVVYQDDHAEPPTTWGDHVAEDGPEMEAYRDGEVYGVAVERLVEWVRPDTGSTREEWEETDSIWGCYLDDTYTARVAASEHFGIKESE